MINNSSLVERLSIRTQRLESSIESNFTPDMAHVTESSSYVALTGNALDIIGENLKNQPLSLNMLDVVKSPTGGSTVFSIPGLSGDEAAQVLTGIILNYTTPRAYWDTPTPVEGTLPICMSQDSITSNDGKACAQCPYNDYGSKDGESNAKACKESVLLYLLRPNNILPLLIRVPVSSKARFLKYTARLAGVLVPLCGVVTRISLIRATSKAGKPYALFNFEAISMLSQDDILQARSYSRQLMEIIRTVNVTQKSATAF